jgi:hypothetical protein
VVWVPGIGAQYRARSATIAIVPLALLITALILAPILVSTGSDDEPLLTPLLFSADSGEEPLQAPAPPPDPPVVAGCPIARPGTTIQATMPDCPVVTSDTAGDPDPIPFWGRIDCQEDSRYEWRPADGDPHLTATGEDQGNEAFRQESVLDGDDISGERCELGYDWNSPTDPGTGVKGPGPTVLYHEGDRRVTFISLRIPPEWDVSDPDWRVVFQMKQVEPFNTDQLASMFQLEVRGGNWVLASNWHDLWSVPATPGVWTRFAFDVTYSTDPAKGSIRAYVDLDGDGGFHGLGEQSPVRRVPTLLVETAGPKHLIPPGGSIPSHLRAGLYQNPNYSCPPPAGCWMQLDNVQVLGP